MDRLEVSNRNYREYCARTGHAALAPPSWDRAYTSKDDYPVVNIARDDAAAFCDSVGKHLPTEEEWEKAARGAERPLVVWGNWTLPGLANLKGAGPEGPAAVGSFAADISPFNVLDFAGNVQEWVAGDFKFYPASSGTTNRPPPGQGIIRGGSFRTPAQQLSPSWREPLPLTGAGPQLESVGFRCAADAAAALAASIDRETVRSNALLSFLRRFARQN
jgi:formylglycine-generating enzyme required for sulfatase activity